MKIITWNVNGIRAVINKKALAWAFAQKPDALCLQEVKARPEQLSETQKETINLDYVWNPAQKAGYSGVATFYKNKPDDVKLGMGKRKFDVEGRLIATGWAGLRLLNIYFPSGSRGHERVDFKLEFYAELLKVCRRLHKEGQQLILCGDFNTAHNEIDLRNAKQNKNTSGFLPIEREWFQKYLDAGFVDIFRHLYPDKAQYTWWTNILNARARGIGWRLDYFLVSESLLPRVKDLIIHDSVLGSDHCPVELVLQ